MTTGGEPQDKPQELVKVDDWAVQLITAGDTEYLRVWHQARHVADCHTVDEVFRTAPLPVLLAMIINDQRKDDPVRFGIPPA